MSTYFSSFLYIFLFVVLYFEVFLILTLLEGRKGIKEFDAELERRRDEEQNNERNSLPGSGRVYQTVTIIVPIFNEEKTVAGTIHSLLDLNYPKDKLSIMVVDDGSKDNTWNIVQQFKDNPQILLHQKKNGGKYTALNYAIEHSTTEYIGCLDADSFVDSEALNHILPYFDDPTVAAVTPSLKIQNPDSILGMIQNAEYNMGVFTRKVLGLLDAQYVTPGPFSIFRKDVFNIVGMYKHAHNTEDLEMALRLQDHHFKIKNAHKALVYTCGPRTLYKLYKQRVRWTGGFIQNTLDYKKMILNPEYGNLGLLVLPTAMFSIVASLFFIGLNLWNIIMSIYTAYERALIVGISFNIDSINSDWILYHLQTSFMLGIFATLIIIFSILYGKRLTGIKDNSTLDIIYFLLLYSFISPFWLITSVYNTIRQRDAAWR